MMENGHKFQKGSARVRYLVNGIPSGRRLKGVGDQLDDGDKVFLIGWSRSRDILRAIQGKDIGHVVRGTGVISQVHMVCAEVPKGQRGWCGPPPRTDGEVG